MSRPPKFRPKNLTIGRSVFLWQNIVLTLMNNPVSVSLLSGIKCAWQRATKGYCFRDLWSIDDWFLQIMPKMLDEYIEINHGYPSDMTDEEWVEIVNKIANSFRNTHKEMTEFVNPYNEEYLSALNFDLENGKFKSTASDELEENFRASEKAKEEFMEKSLDEGLNMFRKYLRTLWD